MKWKKRAAALKRDLPALYLALKNPATPLAAKLAAGAAVAYALSPVDLIPDFIPVLGYVDDLLVLPALAALAIRLIPPEVWRECRAQAGDMWQNGKPKKWYYALPIVIFWLLVAWVLARALLGLFC